MKKHDLISRPWFPFLAFLAAIIFVDIGKDVVTMVARGVPLRPQEFREQALWWSSWLLLMPVVMRIAQWTRPERLGWRRTVIAQMGFGILWVPIHTGLSVAGFTLLPPQAPPGMWRTRFFGMLDNYFVSGFAVYVAAVVTYLVWSYHARLRDRDLAAAASELRAAKLETLVRDARMDALRKELDPHFLHNALQSVSGLVRGGENQRAVQMISALGGHLRELLQGGASSVVTLAEEIDLLERYVEIESVRFEDRMRVEFIIAPETRSLRIPPLLLQPLVENAVRHGIARTVKPVLIQIRSEVVGDVLKIRVEDDGPGPNGTSTGGTGVGLANTRERLRHTFGEEAGLTLETRVPMGAIAQILIPIEVMDRQPEAVGV